jgi:hypothetical protein
MGATRLIAATVLALPILWGGIARGEVFANPGFYTVTVDGWVRSASPDGFRYRCTTCKEQVDIAIEYGPDAPWKTNDQFMASIATEKQQKDYADDLMKGSLPTDKRVKVEVKRVGLSEIGGLRVLMIETQLSIGSSAMLDTFMIAVHRGRIMYCAVRSPAGNPDSEKAINAFWSGLVFEK